MKKHPGNQSTKEKDSNEKVEADKLTEVSL